MILLSITFCFLKKDKHDYGFLAIIKSFKKETPKYTYLK